MEYPIFLLVGFVAAIAMIANTFKQNAVRQLMKLFGAMLLFVMLLSVLFPPRLSSRPLSHRAISRANARGIGQSLYIYHNDFGSFPELDWRSSDAQPDEAETISNPGNQSDG